MNTPDDGRSCFKSEGVLRSPSPNFAVSNLLLLPSVGLGPRRREEEGENLYFKESQSGVDMDRVAVAFAVDGPPGNISSLPPSLARLVWP